MSISEKKIKKYLKSPIEVYCFDEIDSTNNEARRRIDTQSDKASLYVSSYQTSGRGRLGRSFYSPADTGLYMTLSLPVIGENTDRITCACAVAVTNAIEETAKIRAGIKWVNDIFIDGKKVAGILTELVTDEKNTPIAVIIGIGVNLTTNTFPDGIIAGSVGDVEKELLCARIADNIINEYAFIGENSFFEKYKERSIILGETVSYTQNGIAHTAKALDIASDGALIVEESGEIRTLRSGEISIKTKPPRR